ITATQELVVPRSIPMTLLMDTSYQKQNRTAPEGTVSIPREVSAPPDALGGCDAGYICVGSEAPATGGRSMVRIAGALPRDRLGQLSHGYSGVLRGLVSEPAAGRVLPCRQPLWRQRLRGCADPGGGRRFCLLDPQHAAADDRSRQGPADRALCRAVHADRLPARPRKLGHSSGRGSGATARIAPPVRPARRGLALRP